MYIEGQATEFSAFLKDNAAFWSEHTGVPADAEARIFVDLAHDNPAYLLTNLWIAKYLQRTRPARVVGLASAWPKACPHYDFDVVKRLADSFLIDEVIDLDRLGGEDYELTTDFKRQVEGLNGGPLRRAVLQFARDMDPDLGWVLYDTWLRQERIGSFDDPSPALFECADRVFRARRAVEQAMQGTIAAAVTGHYHYSPYAWMARTAVRQRAPVLFQSLLLPVSIRRFSSEDDFRRGRAADFLSAYEASVARAVSPERLDAFARRMFDIQSGVREFFRVVRRTGAVRSRDEMLRQLDLEPQRPTVCLFVPALCGPAHCFGPLDFDDNGEWLRQSLAIAARIPDVNFLVKGHPQDAVYDLSDLVGQCQTAYIGHPNIRFLPSDLSLDQVAQLCDVAVTVSGTPGYEMAARGVATIAAGPSRYADLGFSKSTSTLEQYEALLRDPLQVRLGTEQQQAAVRFLYFETTAGRSQTMFVPPLRLAGTATFWTEAAQHLRSRLPEEDPLFRNLRHMLEHGLPFLLNADVVAPATVEPSQARPPVESWLAGLHVVSRTAVRLLEDRLATADRELARLDAERAAAWNVVAACIDGGCRLRLARGHAAVLFLTAGWSVPEEEGVWTDGALATISLPSSRPEAQLCIECHAYVPEESPVRLVTAWQHGVQVSRREFHRAESGLAPAQLPTLEFPQGLRIPVQARDGRIEVTLKIDRPVVPAGGTRRLGVMVHALWLE